MRLNFHVGPVRTQMNNTQKMNNSDKSKQDNPNLHVCSTDKIKSKRIKAGDRNSKRVVVNACSSEKSESKSVHITFNTSKVKDAINEIKDEETLIIDNSVINAPISFKIF